MLSLVFFFVSFNHYPYWIYFSYPLLPFLSFFISYWPLFHFLIYLTLFRLPFPSIILFLYFHCLSSFPSYLPFYFYMLPSLFLHLFLAISLCTSSFLTNPPFLCFPNPFFARLLCCTRIPSSTLRYHSWHLGLNWAPPGCRPHFIPNNVARSWDSS